MTDKPELSAWFWEVLESSNRSLRTLCRQLEQASKAQLCRYKIDFDDAKACVNPCFWDECLEYLSDDCSEDHGDDFAAWVVMQGRAFFERVVAQPEDIDEYLEMFSAADAETGDPETLWDLEVDRDEYRGYQRADYIAEPIYLARFGQDLHDACYDERGGLRNQD